jgi:hypothetical protein
VVVATRVREHGEQICDEGFTLRPIAWRRRGDGLFGAARAIAAIARLYRAERPDILHHVALKPVLFGSLARRLAFARSDHAPASVASVMVSAPALPPRRPPPSCSGRRSAWRFGSQRAAPETGSSRRTRRIAPPSWHSGSTPRGSH